MGGITLLGAVLVHNDELGGRCGCSKRNKPRRHFDCVASGTASDDDSSDGFGGSGFSIRIRPDEPQDSHNQPDPPTSRTIVSRTVKSKIAKQVLVRKQETLLFLRHCTVVRPSRDETYSGFQTRTETDCRFGVWMVLRFPNAKSPPLHAGSAHEQSRAEVPSKYVPSTRGVSHTKARSGPSAAHAPELQSPHSGSTFLPTGLTQLFRLDQSINLRSLGWPHGPGD